MAYAPSPYVREPDFKPKKIVRPLDNSKYILGYCFGNKDPWCVAVWENNIQLTHKARDVEYFTVFKNMVEKYGEDIVVVPFLKVFMHTTDKVDLTVLQYIRKYAKKHSDFFKSDTFTISYLFNFLYLAMISEYYYINKRGQPSVVNKYVKLIGIYQTLYNENMTTLEAANWSKGKNPRTVLLPYADEISADLNVKFEKQGVKL